MSCLDELLLALSITGIKITTYGTSSVRKVSEVDDNICASDSVLKNDFLVLTVSF